MRRQRRETSENMHRSWRGGAGGRRDVCEMKHDHQWPAAESKESMKQLSLDKPEDDVISCARHRRDDGLQNHIYNVRHALHHFVRGNFVLSAYSWPRGVKLVAAS